MRIIAGVARGRRLEGPRNAATRPMTDRAREGLFSSIAQVIPDADVVDLYAGSGSLGLEALSRGAASVTFVEHDRAALRTLEGNVERVGLGGVVERCSVERFLTRGLDTFDLAFVDPPYACSLASVSEIMELLTLRMRPEGHVVLHRRAGEDRPNVAGLKPAGDRRYGTTQLWRYVKETG